MIDGVRSFVALTKAREEFLEMARSAERAISAVRVQSALEARDYSTGPMIELFVDVALGDDRAVVAWLDIALAEAEFRISPSLRFLHGENETVQELAERFASTEDEFADELASATRQLIVAFGKVNLAQPDDSFGQS